jgi:hypothetical protein
VCSAGFRRVSKVRERGIALPERETVERARQDAREGKAPSTQAGEFVREEIEHIREGKHGARSTKQAVAIGLSKARRAGVPLPPPEKGRGSARTRKQAAPDNQKGQRGQAAKPPAPARSRAVLAALKREGHAAASRPALAKQAKQAARKRSKTARSQSAKQAARTRRGR